MAMVTITNGDVVSKVPYAAYQSQFKNLGFSIVGEEKPAAPKKEEKKEEKKDEVVIGNAEDEDVEDDTEEEDEQENDDAAFVEDILEKPLSQWTVDELKEFVRIKGIDTSGAKKTSEVRSIVKKFLEEQDKAAVNS